MVIFTSGSSSTDLVNQNLNYGGDKGKPDVKTLLSLTSSLINLIIMYYVGRREREWKTCCINVDVNPHYFYFVSLITEITYEVIYNLRLGVPAEVVSIWPTSYLKETERGGYRPMTVVLFNSPVENNTD